jgi:hypothetical protein
MLERVLAATAVGAALVATAPAAHAANTVCRVVKVGDGSAVSLGLCVSWAVNGNGTTVAPTVTVTCGLPPSFARPKACSGTTAGVGTTGFVPNPSFPTPAVDPATGSVRVYDGTVGTLYVNGTPIDVPITGFCVGDPAFCA